MIEMPHSKHMHLVETIRKHGRNFQAASEALGIKKGNLKARLQTLKRRFKEDPGLEGADIMDIILMSEQVGEKYTAGVSRWTPDEKKRLIEGVRKFGKSSLLLSEAVGTKSVS